MRRGRNFFDDDMNMKVIKYSCIGIGILAVIVLGLLLYSKSLNDEVKEGTLSSEQFAELMNLRTLSFISNVKLIKRYGKQQRKMQCFMRPEKRRLTG